MNNDGQLLLRYAKDGAQEAFTKLVRRHVDLVYSAALRRCDGNAFHAEEATQQVFIAVARHAEKLANHPALEAWLYTATRNAVINILTVEQRRAEREQEAAMNGLLLVEDNGPHWEELRPVLDAVMDELNETDRTAVLLRFFKKRSYAEVGVALKISENTARVKTDRALDRLRLLLGKRGVRSSAAVLALQLGGQAVQAAPSAVVAGIAACIAKLENGSATGAAATSAAGSTKTVATLVALVAALGLITLGIFQARSTRVEPTRTGLSVVASGQGSLGAIETVEGKTSHVTKAIVERKSAEVVRPVAPAEALPSDPAPSDPKALEILQKMAAAYAALTSYQDRGEVAMIQENGTRLRTVTGFEFQFQRPSTFRVVWNEGLRSVATGQIVSDGTRTELKPNKDSPAVLSKSASSALMSGSIFSRGGGYHVPTLFFPKDQPWLFRLTDLVEVSLIGVETIEGTVCQHINGKHPDGIPYDLWIGKDDYFLRRLKANGAASPLISMVPTRRHKTSLDYEETHRDIRTNIPMSPILFRVTATDAQAPAR
ncbi:MAG: sigma-70 family RNA polymerase sigma factor [Nibricoccus sp.]